MKNIKNDQLKVSARPSREIKSTNQKIINSIYSVADVLTHVVALVDAIESVTDEFQDKSYEEE